jgi:tRNA threonylcarbamoyladenosine biosynthesis protein TsaB
VAAAIDARRDQVYLQLFDAGHALMAPDVLPLAVAHARIGEIAAGRPLTAIGSGAALVARHGDAVRDAAGCDARQVARLAAGRAATPIRPLYLRAPDAKLPA